MSRSTRANETIVALSQNEKNGEMTTNVYMNMVRQIIYFTLHNCYLFST